MTGDAYRNSRALRQVDALEGAGWTVHLAHFPSSLPAPSDRPRALGDGVTVEDLDRPAGSGPRFFWRIHRRMKAAARRISAAVYHASDLYVLPAVAKRAGAAEAGLTFDSRELYPYVAGAAGRPWVRWFWKVLEHRYLPRVDALFTVSPSIGAHLRARYAVPDPILIPNVPPRQDPKPSDHLRESAGLDPDTPIVLHQGSIQADRGCEVLVRAARRLERGTVVFLGGGPLRDRLRKQVSAEGSSDRVRFVDPVPPDRLLPVTAGATVGVSLLQATCRNHEYALPNKFFEYLMAGLPVVVSDLPEMGGLVREYDVGRVVPPEDPVALAETLSELLARPDLRERLAENGGRLLDRYAWERAEDVWVEAFDRVRAPESPPSNPTA